MWEAWFLLRSVFEGRESSIWNILTFLPRSVHLSFSLSDWLDPLLPCRSRIKFASARFFFWKWKLTEASKSPAGWFIPTAAATLTAVHTNTQTQRHTHTHTRLSLIVPHTGDSTCQKLQQTQVWTCLTVVKETKRFCSLYSGIINSLQHIKADVCKRGSKLAVLCWFFGITSQSAKGCNSGFVKCFFTMLLSILHKKGHLNTMTRPGI